MGTHYAQVLFPKRLMDDYVAIPLKESEKMRIGYIRHKGANLSRLGEIYLQELRKNGKTIK